MIEISVSMFAAVICLSAGIGAYLGGYLGLQWPLKKFMTKDHVNQLLQRNVRE